ncbi:MAG: branched-chain amino acid ABC transporter permease [Rhizobacter sp.]|nr:branched-chain amino acid ABC transporter permease [Chlorobiales bacterium]
MATHKNAILFTGLTLLIFALNFVSGAINAYYFQILIYIGISIILATSLNLINGYTGQFSLGHAGFMAIGGYASAALTHYYGAGMIAAMGGGSFGEQVTFFLSLVLAGATAGAAGLVVGVPSLRLKGDYLAITTLGFGEIIRVLIQNAEFVGGARGFTGISKYTNFFWVFFMVLVVIYLVHNLTTSTFGRAFLSVRDDEVASEAMGINTTNYKVIAFLIGSVFAGIAGALYAHFVLYLNPEDFGFLRSIEIVVMVILGGMGNLAGVAIAAVILTILPEALRFVSNYRMVIYALMLIILMLVRPQGIFGDRKVSSFFKRPA